MDVGRCKTRFRQTRHGGGGGVMKIFLGTILGMAIGLVCYWHFNLIGYEPTSPIAILLGAIPTMFGIMFFNTLMRD